MVETCLKARLHRVEGRTLSPLFPQIEELYEAYCLQRRLRDGANKLAKAFNASQISKEAKESLAEANKGYKEYTEVRRRGRRREGEDAN